MVDTGTFYKLHHDKYGWPSSEKKYCFINWQYNLKKHWVPLEQDTPNLLYLVGALTFLDVNTEYERDIERKYSKDGLIMGVSRKEIFKRWITDLIITETKHWNECTAYKNVYEPSKDIKFRNIMENEKYLNFDKSDYHEKCSDCE